MPHSLGAHVEPRNLQPGMTYSAVPVKGCKHCKGPDNPEGETVVKKAKVRHFGKGSGCTVVSGTCTNTGKPTKVFMRNK